VRTATIDIMDLARGFEICRSSQQICFDRRGDGAFSRGLTGTAGFGKSSMITVDRLSAAWPAARVVLTPYVDQTQQMLIALTSLIQGNRFN